jgi:hypothetical protein
MKFNWGHGITIFIICFMSLILMFVFKTTQLNTELYAKDYYDQEIKYQDKINAITNFKHLNQSVLTDQNETAFKIILPPFFSHKKFNGNVYFYRPENSLLDLKIPISNNTEISVSKNKISKGKYTMKLSFNDDIRAYFVEQKIIIQ